MEKCFDHSGYVRYIEHSKYAVLMIHGIAGTPAHFNMLYNVIPQDVSIYNMLLEGHSKNVEDFGRASMKKWKEQVWETVNDILNKHEYIICVAHSMGCLFSIQLAINDPQRIKGLFLLAVPLRPWVSFKTNIASLKIMFGLDKKYDPQVEIMKNATGINLVPKPWKYIRWFPRLLELVVETQKVRRVVKKLNVPCKTFQSRFDELVAFSTCNDLQKVKCITNTVLYESGHFNYGDNDIKTLNREFERFLHEI